MGIRYAVCKASGPVLVILDGGDQWLSVDACYFPNIRFFCAEVLMSYFLFKAWIL